ncbi:GMC family oxidoreductase [Inhella proteolytica]|uniref:GMC family oxidoreductase n=1 Tax=Inhella proteolytica TaxID=2795029 RepID=A0A931J0N9_9BURK|nr:GMC family oxidoreductase [Inhella proteolytica]MBH9575965.1 GMC family oxidoreductase [Inhella proteolytica]
MSSLPDPIQEGLARGWQVRGGEHGALPAEVAVDVAIIGSGAGGGITAEMLSKAGLKVLVIEEGPLRSSRHFRQREAEAYPQLYQESAGRKTADKGITILQGRCVGGSTTVNWTSSFRTPAATLAYWQQHFGLGDFGPEQMAPWFAQAEQRLNVSDWLTAPNANNTVLERGANKLGIKTPHIRRNVKGCWNLGSCGMGCPTNAKQSMLVTTLPAALEAGAQLFVQTRVQRLQHDGQTIQALHCVPVSLNSAAQPGACVIKARHVVLAGGAINSPALLLRSQAPDPHGLLGRRTFLHPTVGTSAQFDERIEGWAGAPQSIYSDHYLETQAIDGAIGFKLEAPPLYPVIMATTMAGFGPGMAQQLKDFPHTQVLLALLRDGFHPDAPGGQVQLRSDGSPVLDYPLTATLMDGVRRAYLAMAEIQFAAGARTVQPLHEQAAPYKSWAEAKAAIQALDYRPLSTRVVSAHVMGGCNLAGNEQLGVCRPDGKHWQLQNLSVHDGSLFPTSIGANPQLSIYGLVTRLTSGLAQRLTGRAVQLAAAA